MLCSLDRRHTSSQPNEITVNDDFNIDISSDDEAINNDIASVGNLKDDSDMPTYSTLMERCKTLCTMLKNNPMELKKLDSTFVEMTTQYRKKWM